MSKAFGFEPLHTRTHPDGGFQFLYAFPNGYGASIVPSGYGPYLAEREGVVIHWFDKENELGWEYDWTTPVAQYSIRLDVIGGVEEFLNEISQLPPRKG